MTLMAGLGKLCRGTAEPGEGRDWAASDTARGVTRRLTLSRSEGSERAHFPDAADQGNLQNADNYDFV
ncbi:hypothetical protein GCM10022290_36820 [Sagittula marina]